MANSATSSLLVILLLVSPLLCICSSQGSSNTLRVTLTHVDANRHDLSPLQIIKRSIDRGKQRHRQFLNGLMMSTQSSSDVRTRVVGGDGEFRMSLSIGTPPVPLLAIMDTGSDLIWTQCKPCKTCFTQPTPIFDPAESSSFANVSCLSPVCKKWTDSRCVRSSCEFSNSYGDGTSTEGFLATESFNFGGSDIESSVPDIGFGCGVNNQGPGLNHGAGIVGLGRGPLSLVSQLHTRQFAYCLTSIGGTNGSSSLFIGSAPSSVKVSNASTTPLLENPLLPTFYYISLVGISVGRNRLRIPPSWFQLTSDGTGGLIVDSGTTITLLTEDAYDVLRREFLGQTKLALSEADHSGLDLCFDLPHGKRAKQIAVPELTFHFTGLDLALPPENYMIVDEKLRMACLAIAPVGGFSTLGNIQQQNMLVIHNLEQKTMSFIPTDCGKL